MKKSIKTYEDLLAEEQRLTAELSVLKEHIRTDVGKLRESLNPIKRAAQTAKNLFTFGDNGPLVNFGLRFGTDVVLRRLLLGRAGWIAKVVVPYVIKNYASHLVTDEQRKSIAKSVSNLMSKFLMKKKKEPFPAAPPTA